MSAACAARAIGTTPGPSSVDFGDLDDLAEPPVGRFDQDFGPPSCVLDRPLAGAVQVRHRVRDREADVAHLIRAGADQRPCDAAEARHVAQPDPHRIDGDELENVLGIARLTEVQHARLDVAGLDAGALGVVDDALHGVRVAVDGLRRVLRLVPDADDDVGDVRHDLDGPRALHDDRAVIRWSLREGCRAPT